MCRKTAYLALCLQPAVKMPSERLCSLEKQKDPQAVLQFSLLVLEQNQTLSWVDKT